MKMISGLPDEYIRFDAASFINQLRETNKHEGILAESFSTHPSLILRARSLLWFSMNDEIEIHGDVGALPLNKINSWVRKDLDKYIDTPLRKIIQEAELDLFFWSAFMKATESGRLTKIDRNILVNKFGEVNLNKAIAAIKEMSTEDVHVFVQQRIEITLGELEKLISNDIGTRLDKINKEAALLLKDDS